MLPQEKSEKLLPPRHQYIDMTFDHGETSGMVGSKAVERDETRQSHAEYPALFEPAETNGSIHNGQFKVQPSWKICSFFYSY